MIKPKIGLVNLSEVDAIFDELLLTDKEGNRIKNNMLRDTFRPTLKDAKANLNSDGSVITGELSYSLGIISKVRSTTAYAAAGARRKGNYRGYHFHFVNSGTANRQTATGSNRGAVTGSMFFDKAVTSNLGAMPNVMQEAFNKRLQTFINKKY